jgi:O-antigen/teichoic acid export membrane protein
MKFMLIIAAPISFLLVFLGEHVLKLYVGIDLSLKMVSVLKLLALGFLIGTLGNIVHNYVLALGYPHAIAKFHLVELPLYTGIAFGLTAALGIQGMALGWMLRRILEAGYVFLLFQKIESQNIRALIANGFIRALIMMIALGFFVAMTSTIRPELLMWAILAIGMIVFGILIWNNVFNSVEKKGFISMIRNVVREVDKC